MSSESPRMPHHSKHDYEELNRRDKRFGEGKRTATPYKRPRRGGRSNLEGIEEDDGHYKFDGATPIDGGTEGI